MDDLFTPVKRTSRPAPRLHTAAADDTDKHLNHSTAAFTLSFPSTAGGAAAASAAPPAPAAAMVAPAPVPAPRLGGPTTATAGPASTGSTGSSMSRTVDMSAGGAPGPAGPAASMASTSPIRQATGQAVDGALGQALASASVLLEALRERRLSATNAATAVSSLDFGSTTAASTAPLTSPISVSRPRPGQADAAWTVAPSLTIKATSPRIEAPTGVPEPGSPVSYPTSDDDLANLEAALLDLLVWTRTARASGAPLTTEKASIVRVVHSNIRSAGKRLYPEAYSAGPALAPPPKTAAKASTTLVVQQRMTSPSKTAETPRVLTTSLWTTEPPLSSPARATIAAEAIAAAAPPPPPTPTSQPTMQAPPNTSAPTVLAAPTASTRRALPAARRG